MKTKAIATILIMALIALLINWYIYCLGYNHGYDDGHYWLPGPLDIQRMLNNRGANLKVDGIVGAETIQAWNEIKMNEYLGD